MYVCWCFNIIISSQYKVNVFRFIIFSECFKCLDKCSLYNLSILWTTGLQKSNLCKNSYRNSFDVVIYCCSFLQSLWFSLASSTAVWRHREFICKSDGRGFYSANQVEYHWQRNWRFLPFQSRRWNRQIWYWHREVARLKSELQRFFSIKNSRRTSLACWSYFL